MAEVVGVDPCGVGEQEQSEGDLGQSVHGIRLDRQVDDGPGSVAQEESGGDEHDRAGHVEPLDPSGHQRPTEQEDDEGQQRAGGHADASQRRWINRADSGFITGGWSPCRASCRPGEPKGLDEPARTAQRQIGDLVRAVRVEFGDPQRVGQQARRRREPGQRHDRRGAVGCHHAVGDRSVVAPVDAQHVTGVQQFAVAAVECHDVGDPVEFGVVEVEQVPLQAEMAEERGGGAERERVGAAGRVAAGRADVRAHHLGWDQRRCPPLDGLALERVVAVARPHPLGSFEDAEIDPPTAGGATLDLHVGMVAAEQIDEAVHGPRLGVGGGAASGVAGRDVHPVHVPLEEVDLVVAQQSIESTVDRGERIGPGQVEHELMPSEHRFVPRRLQGPFGVGAVEVAVGADHLRFDPQAELHAEPADVVDQRSESVRVDVG